MTTPAPQTPDEPTREPVSSASVPPTADSSPVSADAVGDAVSAVFRTALRDTLLLLGGLLVLGVGLGALLAGTAGVWGALMGVGIALVFSGTTIVAMARTARSTPTTTAAVVLGSWLVKIVLLGIVLAVLRNYEFYDRIVFAVVLLVGVIGSALLDYRAVDRGRIPYVTPKA
ncbi:hypothetical protein [Oerskovia paurometabola]|uniref:ATP synthase protein I n=1 Tax=Oerskovia paurometabola TaxID=162170 RepID=A0ABW1X4D0_9CELL|nr:hypothetical protein [Oerskovia paurometabola]MBM7498265.1 hypothetical protein [Oerskovia paurometabola]